METYTKDTLRSALSEIRNAGWVPNARPGNAGGVGNTLEDMLGIEENNLPMPNAAEWELKCHRAGSNSLTTLFHMEPSPKALKLIPGMLLPKYGWPHKEAGKRYKATEMSFRQTIHGKSHSDRGFIVIIDKREQKVSISFDVNFVDPKHKQWIELVAHRVGLGELDPQPYWGFTDLFHKAGTKLLNTFYVSAEVKQEDGTEYFRYSTILQLEGFSLDKFLAALVQADVLVDFDARSGHNHGTKFRLRQNRMAMLYDKVEELV